MASRILVADDSAMLRGFLVDLLSRTPDFLVVAETGSGLEAVRLTARARPDLALIDVDLPDIDGIQVSRRITGLLPDTKVTLFSNRSDPGIQREAVEAMAHGYLVKNISSVDLIAALRTVVAGGRAFPEIGGANRGSVWESWGRLTQREQEVFWLVGCALPNRKIAERLSLALETVQSDRKNIIRKLGVRKVAELVRIAHRLQDREIYPPKRLIPLLLGSHGPVEALSNEGQD